MTGRVILSDCATGDWLRVPCGFVERAAAICGFSDYETSPDHAAMDFSDTREEPYRKAAAEARRHREDLVMEEYLRDWPRMPHDRSAKAGRDMPLSTLMALRGD